ncbi:hypothetical protein GCM10010915_07000 [Microbacterium faecale]|uniref:Uncharacterized protein n=1 Tax=Microbacterium faecale TaxID=1804630 RepID=A0A917DCR3_9MICO|nr:hypothetical protein GCM10010915_07000 [Microbacterium faecale]
MDAGGQVDAGGRRPLRAGQVADRGAAHMTYMALKLAGKMHSCHLGAALTAQMTQMAPKAATKVHLWKVGAAVAPT